MHALKNHTLAFLALLLTTAAVPGSLRAQVAYPPNGPSIAPIPLNGSAAPPYPTPKSEGAQSQWNMELAGWNDLQGRSAYQPIIISQNGRFIAYVGHHATAHSPMNPLTGKAEPSGTSIVDVTDPTRTKYLAHIPGPAGTDESGGAQMVRVCSGNTLPRATRGKWYLLRPRGSEAHEIYDLRDPAKPVYIRDFGLVGSQPNAATYEGVQKGIGIHGMISAGPQRNRVYMAYGSGRNGVLQIVDRQKLLTAFKNPLNPTTEEMLAPQVGYVVMSPENGAHTTMPLFGVPIPAYQQHTVMKTRDLVIITSEQGRGDHCAPGPNGDRPAPHLAYLVDVTNEATPWNLSTFHVDERQGDFCGKGGRFGAHAGTESFYPPYYGKLAIFSWFNAGTRVFDIRNPFDVREIAYFIPSVNKNTMSFCVDGISHPDGDPKITPECTKVIQTNNVEIDDRGLIYSADRAGSGLHIMRLMGAAAAAVAKPGTN